MGVAVLIKERAYYARNRLASIRKLAGKLENDSVMIILPSRVFVLRWALFMVSRHSVKSFSNSLIPHLN